MDWCTTPLALSHLPAHALHGPSGIFSAMEIAQIRSRWVEVLDALERQDRVAWLAFFDARLARLEGSTLFLDYSDANKFSGGHEFTHFRLDHRQMLEKTIESILGLHLSIEQVQ